MISKSCNVGQRVLFRSDFKWTACVISQRIEVLGLTGDLLGYRYVVKPIDSDEYNYGDNATHDFQLMDFPTREDNLQ